VDNGRYSAAGASADQVGPSLRARGMLFPSQAYILETEVTTATRIAEFMFDKGLAQASARVTFVLVLSRK
jgi:malate dehydrogenase (oxaloacetate-decarboxylating)(NADP+)